jgi:hypothetical protein
MGSKVGSAIMYCINHDKWTEDEVSLRSFGDALIFEIFVGMLKLNYIQKFSLWDFIKTLISRAFRGLYV